MWPQDGRSGETGYTEAMCGRYARKSDKQRIADAFDVRQGLEELYLEAEGRYSSRVFTACRSRQPR